MKFLSLISLLAGALLVSAGSYGRHSEKCIPKETLEVIVPKYIAAFSGITDGGKQARRVFRQDFKQYSQSTWWVTPGQGDVIAAHAAVSFSYNNVDRVPDLSTNSYPRPMTTLPSSTTGPNSSDPTSGISTTPILSSKVPSPMVAIPSLSTGRSTLRCLAQSLSGVSMGLT
jgi:hypothetical protein